MRHGTHSLRNCLPCIGVCNFLVRPRLYPENFLTRVISVENLHQNCFACILQTTPESQEWPNCAHHTRKTSLFTSRENQPTLLKALLLPFSTYSRNIVQTQSRWKPNYTYITSTSISQPHFLKSGAMVGQDAGLLWHLSPC